MSNLDRAALLINGLVDKGWLQNDIANEIGVPYPYISSWKHHKYRITETQLESLQSLAVREGINESEPQDTDAIDDSNSFGIELSSRLLTLGIDEAELQKEIRVGSPESTLSVTTINNLLSGKTSKPNKTSSASINQALLSIAKKKKISLTPIVVSSAFTEWVFYGPYAFERKAGGINEAPNVSGIYCIYDSSDRPLYVGKAKDLLKRLLQHVEEIHYISPRIADSYGFMVVPIGMLNQLEVAITKFAGSSVVVNKNNRYRRRTG